MTESWVYLFSKFTPEALLFESLGIFVLTGIYAGYWIIKKRRLGAAGEEAIPAGVVKTYLNELIVDAEQMRAQLFGLLNRTSLEASGSVGIQHISSLTALPAGAGPEVVAKMQALEAKMLEQAKAMEKILNEKEKVAAELVAAKAASQIVGAPAAAGAPGIDVSELNAKIASLEAKLAEYSIIEDDLANLKRLQQENAQLRAALNSSGKSVPEGASATPSVAAAVPASTPAPAIAAAPAPEPTPAPAAAEIPPPAEPVAAAATPVEATPTPAPEAAPAAATAAPAVPTDDAFEGLVDQVEKSLQGDGAVAAPAVATTPAPAAASSGALPPTSDKSDADLVEEFEKMLNG